ncbi:MAG: hypothetical protein JWO02_1470 [Solirubrobacterales bacterium]|nr:hypothetical protein [Solirubrobacterales bacterium]
MRPPPLLLERTPQTQVLIAVVVPALFGAMTGLLLGRDEAAYLALSILGVAGGIGAGYEHPGAGEGARRGICGGLLFGTFILLAAAATGDRAQAELADPQWVLVVITTALGALFGAMGGALRGRGTARA